MHFHDIRLPQFIEIFAVGQPEFSSSSVTTISGRTVHSLNMEYSRQKYLITNCRLSHEQFEQFNSFFRARRGQKFAFRFRDHADCYVRRQIIAKGDGNCTTFPLVRLYADSVSQYLRIITKPEKDSVKLYVNAKQLDNVKIDYDRGVVVLTEALPNDAVLFADFIFDVMVRFGSDSFKYSYCTDNSIELFDIILLEVMQ